MWSQRLIFATKCASWHLLVCLVVAAFAFALVFLGWYRFPYDRMLGVAHVFILAVVADVICGPLLTFVLSNPKKSMRERLLDLSFVGVIQIVALAYALHAMYVVRPVVLAFEKDRYVVVSANEVQTQNLSEAPEGLRDLPFIGLLQVGTRAPRDGDEFMKSAELSLAGISPAMRPDWWLPMAENAREIEARAKPLRELVERKPKLRAEIKDGAGEAGVPLDDLRYLPITTSSEKDWIVIFEKPGMNLGYIPVDGF